MGIFGSGSPKRHRLFSNDKALVERLCEKAGYMSRADQSNCTTKLTTKYIDKSGKSRCVGVKTALKESAYLVSCFWQKTVILDFFGSPSFWVLDCDLIDSTSEIGFCETLLWWKKSSEKTTSTEASGCWGFHSGLNYINPAAWHPIPRYYPPAFGDFLAAIAKDLQGVAWWNMGYLDPMKVIFTTHQTTMWKIQRPPWKLAISLVTPWKINGWYSGIILADNFWGSSAALRPGQ